MGTPRRIPRLVLVRALVLVAVLGSLSLTDDRIAVRSVTADESPGLSGAAGPSPTGTSVDPDELGFDEIVFVKRKPYSSDHYYTDINNGTSPDRFLPENGIYIFNVRTKSERAVVTAAELPGGQGFIGKISLSFDARKIVFDFRQDPGAGFRIWEVQTDGTGSAAGLVSTGGRSGEGGALEPRLAHR